MSYEIRSHGSMDRVLGERNWRFGYLPSRAGSWYLPVRLICTSHS
jgi:hypothetical protein